MSIGKVYNTNSRAFDPVHDDGTGTYLTPEEELELWQEHDAWMAEQDADKEEIKEEEVKEEDKGWKPDEAKENIMEITRGMF